MASYIKSSPEIEKLKKVILKLDVEGVLDLLSGTQYHLDVMEALWHAAKADHRRALAICSKAAASREEGLVDIAIELLPEAWKGDKSRARTLLLELTRRPEPFVSAALDEFRGIAHKYGNEFARFMNETR